jgi:hypothetical protein
MCTTCILIYILTRGHLCVPVREQSPALRPAAAAASRDNTPSTGPRSIAPMYVRASMQYECGAVCSMFVCIYPYEVYTFPAGRVHVC